MKVIATFLLSFCATPAAAQTVDSPHFIVIGIDGLSVDGVATAKTPRACTNSWTAGVDPGRARRNADPDSPNWASMIDGAGPEQHGITSNGILRKMVEIEPVCRDSGGMFPTIFEVMRAQQPSNRIAIFHDWPGFANLVEKHAPDVMQHVRGAAKTAETAADYWKRNHPALMFVHLDNVDHTGHTEGWATPPITVRWKMPTAMWE